MVCDFLVKRVLGCDGGFVVVVVAVVVVAVIAAAVAVLFFSFCLVYEFT